MEEDFVEWFGTRALTIRCQTGNRGSMIDDRGEQ